MKRVAMEVLYSVWRAWMSIRRASSACRQRPLSAGHQVESMKSWGRLLRETRQRAAEAEICAGAERVGLRSRAAREGNGGIRPEVAAPPVEEGWKKAAAGGLGGGSVSAFCS
jgi:hypothetical protein